MAVAQSFAAEMGREMRASAGVLDCRFTKKSAHNGGRSLRFAVSVISQGAAGLRLSLALAGRASSEPTRPPCS
jgi:hypothetical protein